MSQVYPLHKRKSESDLHSCIHIEEILQKQYDKKKQCNVGVYHHRVQPHTSRANVHNKETRAEVAKHWRHVTVQTHNITMRGPNMAVP